MKCRRRNSIHAQDDADVLEGSICIVQLRSDGTDLGLLRKLEKRGQPLAVDRLQSPIQEEEMLTACIGRRLFLLAQTPTDQRLVCRYLANRQVPRNVQPKV